MDGNNRKDIYEQIGKNMTKNKQIHFFLSGYMHSLGCLRLRKTAQADLV